MRKFVTLAALGCLAVATAADAHTARVGTTRCLYGSTDRDLVVEIARLAPLNWIEQALS